MKLTDNAYKTLTAEERAPLAINAIGRGDDNEAIRLRDTCPQENCSWLDAAYRQKIRAIQDVTWITECGGLRFLVAESNCCRAQLHDDELWFSFALITLAKTWKQFCEEIGLDPAQTIAAVTGMASGWYSDGLADLANQEGFEERGCEGLLKTMMDIWNGSGY